MTQDHSALMERLRALVEKSAALAKERKTRRNDHRNAIIAQLIDLDANDKEDLANLEWLNNEICTAVRHDADAALYDALCLAIVELREFAERGSRDGIDQHRWRWAENLADALYETAPFMPDNPRYKCPGCGLEFVYGLTDDERG